MVYSWTVASVPTVSRGGRAVAKEGLTPKQAAFVREYLVDLNATQAAIRAGYSEKTADQQASRLLTNVKVQEAVTKGREKLAHKVEVTTERVLGGLLAEATADDGPMCKGARVKAWELLGKHLGLLTDRSKVEVSGDVSALLAASVEKYQELARRQREQSTRAD
jgi:phage terminase small subunit